VGSSSSPVDVLFIAGQGRSGSTFIEQGIAQSGDVCSVGELRHMWRRGYVDNQLCGCGLPFHECSFWTAVLAEYDRVCEISPTNAIELENRVERLRFVPMMRPGRAPRRFAERLRTLREVRSALYLSIARIAGRRIIVDSSKDPSSLYVILGCSAVRITTLHLIRDPRAVAYSWSRPKHRPEITNSRRLMPQYGVLQTGAEWSIRNLMVEGARDLTEAYVSLRYEDFVRDPKAGLEKALYAVGASMPATLFDERGRLQLDHRSHTVSGNPVRFRSGPIEIVEDAAWKRELSRGRRWVLTLLTLPWLGRYGYPARVGRSEKPRDTWPL